MPLDGLLLFLLCTLPMGKALSISFYLHQDEDAAPEAQYWKMGLFFSLFCWLGDNWVDGWTR